MCPRYLILWIAIGVGGVPTDLPVRPLAERLAPLRTAHLQAEKRHLRRDRCVFLRRHTVEGKEEVLALLSVVVDCCMRISRLASMHGLGS